MGIKLTKERNSDEVARGGWIGGGGERARERGGESVRVFACEGEDDREATCSTVISNSLVRAIQRRMLFVGGAADEEATGEADGSEGVLDVCLWCGGVWWGWERVLRFVCVCVCASV